MAVSTCSICKGHRFEMVIKHIEGARLPVTFIQCAFCGTVVGAIKHECAAELVHKLAEKINVKLD